MPGISIAESQKLLQLTDQILMIFRKSIMSWAKRDAPIPDRSSASLYARNCHCSQTAIGMEGCSHLVLLLGATVAPSRSKAHYARSHLATGARGGVEPGAENPGPLEFLDHAHPGRIDMLNTGIRTPVGLKIQGADLNKMQDIGRQAEKLLSVVPGTRNVFAERIGDGYFLDVNWDRQALAATGSPWKTPRAPSRPRLAGKTSAP